MAEANVEEIVEDPKPDDVIVEPVDDADDGTSEVIDDAVVIDEDAAPPDDADDKPPVKKGGVQKRIDTLTKAKNKAKEDAAYWRGMAEGKATSVVSDPKPEVVADKLLRDDFDTEEDYIEALVDKKVKAKVDTTTAADGVTKVQEQYSKGKEKYEDFEEIALSPTLPVSEAMFRASEGDNLSEILYHLGKDPDLALRISRMTPLQAAKEIGKIELGLANPNPNPKPKLKPSGAPDPIPKVKPGGPTPVTTDKDSQKERMTKWEKKRRENLGVK